MEKERQSLQLGDDQRLTSEASPRCKSEKERGEQRRCQEKSDGEG